MITINMTKAKEIAHTVRREKRAEEFKPLDEAIMKQIPNTDIAAIEVERQSIRDKYATMQVDIDAALTVEQLKGAMP